MFFYESAWSDAAVRRFIRRVGAENIGDLFDLRLADIYGMKNRAPNNSTEIQACDKRDAISDENSPCDKLSSKTGTSDNSDKLSDEKRKLQELKARIEKALSQNSALGIKDLAINGNDLLAIGIRPGKEIGIALNELLEAVTDDPEMNTREKLLEAAKRFLN